MNSRSFRLRLFRACSLMLPLLFVGGGPTLSAASGWTRLADLPQPHAFPGQTPQRIGERLYLLAGRDYRIDTLLIYDSTADAWSTASTALLTSRHHFATAALDGRLYVAGGCLGESDAVPHRRTNAFERYDPATGLWTPLAPMLTARQAFQLVAFDGELYAIGGVDQRETPITTIEVYNPSTDAWRSISAPWKGQLGWSAAAVYGDRILILGRIDDRSVFLDYDPRTNTSVEKPVGLAADKRNYAVALAGDRLLLIGAGDEKPAAAVIGFDLSTDAWRELPPLPEARGHAGAVALGDRVLCIGGWGPDWDWAHPNATVFMLEIPKIADTAK